MKKTFIVLFLLAALLPADSKPIKFTLGNWLWKPASNQALLTTSSPTFAGLTLSGGTATLASTAGNVSLTTSIVNKTANEAAFTLNYTVNKSSGFNDTGLKIVQTKIATPASSYIIEAFVGAAQVFGVSSLGAITSNGGYLRLYGSTTAYIQLYESYFGLESANVFQYGADAATPAAQMIKGADATGDDHAGGAFTIAGGRGTDTGAGGSVKIQTAPAGAAASNAGTLVDRVEVDSTGTVKHLGVNSQSTNIQQATVVVTTTAAATATATNLIPAGSMVVGVTCRNTTAVTGSGLTGYSIGDGSDPDRWGANVNPAINETTDLSDCTITSVPIYAAATSVVLTGDGGSFDADKTIRVTVHYISLTAPYTWLNVGILGDSKSQLPYGSWADTMIANIDAAMTDGWHLREDVPRNWAKSQYTVAAIKSSIGTYILAHGFFWNNDFNVFLINLGVNEMAALPAAATWKSDYSYIIDALLTGCPSAKVYLTKPWKRGYDAESNTVSGWIDDIVAAYVISNPNHVYVADDERVWMKGGDDGATMTTDGVHYSTAGKAEKVAQMRTVLGY